MAFRPLSAAHCRDGKGIFFSAFQALERDCSSASASSDTLDAFGLIGMPGLMD